MFGYTKKLEVPTAYRLGMQQYPLASVASIARQCSVSQQFVNRIVEELGMYGRVLRPSKVVCEKRDTKLCGFSATVMC